MSLLLDFRNTHISEKFKLGNKILLSIGLLSFLSGGGVLAMIMEDDFPPIEGVKIDKQLLSEPLGMKNSGLLGSAYNSPTEKVHHYNVEIGGSSDFLTEQSQGMMFNHGGNYNTSYKEYKRGENKKGCSFHNKFDGPAWLYPVFLLGKGVVILVFLGLITFVARRSWVLASKK